MSFFQKRRLAYIPSMRVAIIRTPDVNFDEYQKLIRLLRSIQGQIIFEEFDEVPTLLEERWEKWNIRKKVRWSEASKIMQHIKQDLEYTRDESVVLLTVDGSHHSKADV